MTFRPTIPVLWYENALGERFVPDPRLCGEDVPEGFIYQHFRHPFEVQESICTNEGSVGRGTQSYPGDLALALTRPSWREKFLQVLRYGRWRTRPFDEAIIRSACSCERCMNVLAHEAGLGWGYRWGSREYTRSRTVCEWCRDIPVPPVNPTSLVNMEDNMR